MLTILDNGLRIEDGQFRYAWYRVCIDDGAPAFRCVALKQLDTIPVADRDDYNLLGKMWGAMRGVYNAGVNFVAANAGISSRITSDWCNISEPPGKVRMSTAPLKKPCAAWRRSKGSWQISISPS